MRRDERATDVAAVVDLGLVGDMPGLVLPSIEDRPQMGVARRADRAPQGEFAGGFESGRRNLRNRRNTSSAASTPASSMNTVSKISPITVRDAGLVRAAHPSIRGRSQAWKLWPSIMSASFVWCWFSLHHVAITWWRELFRWVNHAILGSERHDPRFGGVALTRTTPGSRGFNQTVTSSIFTPRCAAGNKQSGRRFRSGPTCFRRAGFQRLERCFRFLLDFGELGFQALRPE